MDSPFSQHKVNPKFNITYNICYDINPLFLVIQKRREERYDISLPMEVYCHKVIDNISDKRHTDRFWS